MFHSFGRLCAEANIRGDGEHAFLYGKVRFFQQTGAILVEARICGLNGGFHGFHIHDGHSCEGPGFARSGNHYDPKGAEHPNHAGDLPPLLGAAGKAYAVTLTDRFSIRDVIGKTVVIHDAPDDFHSQPAGNAGKKIACGVITAVR